MILFILIKQINIIGWSYGQKMKIEKIKIILSIILTIILIITIRNILVKKYNETFVQKYVSKIYPDYTIVEKKYEYLDDFWSTWYETEKDDFGLEITCITSLQSKESGMRISIPFYHSRYKHYKDTKYNRKNIKKMVEEYEKYWNSINNLKEIYNIELNISNVEISESSSCDIYEMTIYLKYRDNLDIDEIIMNINNLETNLNVKNINYVVAKEDTYKTLKPWSESNVYDIVPDGMKRIDKNLTFDLYVEKYDRENNNIKGPYSEYYIKEKL